MLFVKGQKWISESEPELGLGIIEEASKYQVHILFSKAEEKRIFSAENCPLKRVIYGAGDSIVSDQGISMVVESVEEEQGLYVYKGAGAVIREPELAESLNFGKPEERILQGQVDSSEAFTLRYQTMLAYSKARQSNVSGFLGGRIDLIPHQLFIANEVASRHCPRVLLADEVGLGKTIEACLILHRLQITGRASRILIIVPESLVHQWFVELYRRFNLWFTIMDHDRCAAAALSSESNNPFLEEQLVLCSINTLKDNSRWADAICSVDWDLLVVDEAHHYQWKPDFVSPEYTIIERLSQSSTGLILLTATPEQMGIEGHFARLRLLDPNRYPNLDQFIAEHNNYGKIAKVAQAVYQKKPLLAQEKRLLKAMFAELSEADFQVLIKDRDKLLDSLVDQYGTGRVIFRNTRKALKGFPKREAVPQIVEPSPRIETGEMSERLFGEFQKEVLSDEVDLIYDFKYDPRVQWLATFLSEHKSDKVLLICSYKEKVEALQTSLLELLNIKTAVFHEDLSLIQRDRNAAYFAQEEGAQILLCSEIGSEGRNFQFAHHLVLFDLPLNPELLEQRIGRLDRIGQTSTIKVHVPFLEKTWTEFLFKWHQGALEGIENSLKGGHIYYEANKSALIELGQQLQNGNSLPGKALEAFMGKSRAHRMATEKTLSEGQDCLIAINSNRPQKAALVVDAVKALDKDKTLELLMNQLFDFFGVTVEKLGEAQYKVKPDHLYTESFPSLPEEGMTLSFSRQEALSREDIGFLTWDHPMVRGAMDLMVGSTQGNCAIIAWKQFNPQMPAILLECIFISETVAPLKYHLDRFFPAAPIRVVVDIAGVEFTDSCTLGRLQGETLNEEAFRLKESPELLRSILPNLLASAMDFAQDAQSKRLQKATAKTTTHLGGELARLLELQKVNANVSAKEVSAAQAELSEVLRYINQAQLRLDAVRLVLNNPSPRPQDKARSALAE